MTYHAEEAARSPSPTGTRQVSSPRVVLLALSMGGFAIGTAEFAAMALLPDFSADLGVTEARAADAISAYALGVVVGAPVLSVLGARMEPRRVLVLLMVAFGLFNLLSAFAPTFGSFVATRFFAGLPHGAYFGLAALVAASVVPVGKRSSAVARVMLGLTVATTVGVPLANLLAQTMGWRVGFVLVGVLAAATAAAVLAFAPRGGAGASDPLRQLDALRNRQVWLTLATGAIGFGGFFAVYTYLASTLTTTMQAPPMAVPAMLMAAGIGMTFFTAIMGWAADKNQNLAAFTSLGVGTLILLIYPAATASLWTLTPVVLSLGLIGALSTALQTRLMDVAGEAQQLAAAMNHAAFNVANALGPFLAARAVAAGYGFPSSGYVGAGLSFAGLLIFAVTVLDARRTRARREG